MVYTFPSEVRIEDAIDVYLRGAFSTSAYRLQGANSCWKASSATIVSARGASIPAVQPKTGKKVRHQRLAQCTHVCHFE